MYKLRSGSIARVGREQTPTFHGPFGRVGGKWTSHWVAALVFGCALHTALAQPPNEPPARPAPAATMDTRGVLPPDAETDQALPGDVADLQLLEMVVPRVVISATRQEEPIQQLPYAVSVITAEDIRWSGARTVMDALRLAPGVDVAETSYSAVALSPRGGQSAIARRLLVLVDGRQIYDAIFGGTLWMVWPFQLEDIDRIEVIHGPGGVVWGPNAVNGVINIITRDPSIQEGVTLGLSGASRGTVRQYTGIGSRGRAWRWRVSGEHERSEGFDHGGSLLFPLEDRYQGTRFSAFAVRDVSDDERLTLSAGGAYVEDWYAPPPFALFERMRESEARSGFLMGAWTRKRSATEQDRATAYVNHYHSGGPVSAFDYQYHQLALQVSRAASPSETRSLVFGADGRIDLIDGGNAEPDILSDPFLSSANVGLFLVDRRRLSDRWQLDLGARLDYESYGGFEPSARAALSYRLGEESMIYTAVSRAVQMAPAGARFTDLPLLGGLLKLSANRDLDSEKLVAYELGYRTARGEALSTGVTLYWHDYDDVTTITPRLGFPTPIVMYLDNTSQMSAYGLEWEARWVCTNQLTLLANYTYQQLDWRSALDYNDTDSLRGPKHQAMLAARYSPTDDLHLSSHLYFVDTTEGPEPSFPLFTRKIDPYLRLDLRAEFEFRKDSAFVAVGVRNLLDPDHPEGTSGFQNYAEVPRMVFAEMRMKLK